MDHVLKDCKYQSCNEHWEPQYIHCEYCDIRYDIIGRVENLDYDLEYIAMINDFTSDLYPIKDDLHVHRSGTKRFEKPTETFIRNNGIKEKIEKTKSYFKLLNSTQMNNIYHMYKIDFEMFGYSTKPYHPLEFI